MRFQRHFLLSALLLLATGSAECLAQMTGPGQMGGPMHGAPVEREPPAGASEGSSASDLVGAAYKAGEGYMSKAKDADIEAARIPDDKKKAKALIKASKLYDEALGKFEDAVDKDPGLVDAWNNIGLCDFHLGAYDEAVTAYGNVLELNPGYSEAYQRRAEAYLGLNKIADAKSDYMTLSRIARPLANELMSFMRQWIDARKLDPKGVKHEELAAFITWADESAATGQ
jgi:tetratricopeptide (TPR) repeat protein